jgi:hypothetical protein
MIVAEESLLAKPLRHEREPEYRMWSWRGRHAREQVCSQAPCRRDPRWRMDKLAAPAVAPGDRRLVSPRRPFRRGWVETASGQTERINTVLLDLDGTLYVGGPALTMSFHTNTDSVTLAVLADRLGRLGAAATEDELDAAFRPEGVDGHRDADRSPGDGQRPVSGARPAPTRSRQEATRWQGARARPRPGGGRRS